MFEVSWMHWSSNQTAYCLIVLNVMFTVGIFCGRCTDLYTYCQQTWTVLVRHGLVVYCERKNWLAQRLGLINMLVLGHVNRLVLLNSWQPPADTGYFQMNVCRMSYFFDDCSLINMVKLEYFFKTGVEWLSQFPVLLSLHVLVRLAGLRCLQVSVCLRCSADHTDERPPSECPS